MQRNAYGITSWAAATLGYFLQNGILVLPAVLFAALSKSLNFTDAELGVFSAAFLFTFTMAQIPVGAMYDRFQSNMLLAISYFFMMLGCLVFALSTNLMDAIIARMLMGFGAGFTFVGALYLSRSWFDADLFSTMVGFTEAASAVGSFLLNMAFVVINYFFSWQAVVYGLVVLLGGLAIGSFFLVRDNQRVIKHKVNLRQEMGATIRNKKVWLISIYGFLAYSHYIAIILMWGTPFMVARYHMKEFSAVLLDSSCIFGYILGCGLLGRVNRILPVQKIILYSILAQTMVYAFLIYFKYPAWGTFILEFITGIITSHVMLVFVLAETHLPKKLSGITTGFINTFLLAVGIVMIPITGKIYESTNSILYAVIPILICQLLAIPIAFYFNYSKAFQTEMFN